MSYNASGGGWGAPPSSEGGWDVAGAPGPHSLGAGGRLPQADPREERAAGGAGQLPEAAERRLHESSFTSGLSVPEFAACLHMGLRPLALVQGFCVMQSGWYGMGSPYMRGASPFSYTGNYSGYSKSYRCPHGYVSGEHRLWGQNYEQPWVERSWALGFGSAYERMIAEAREIGAHGIVGVVDRASPLVESNVTEFHVLGTAVHVEGAPRPKGEPWTTYLAGQRLAKLIEAGLMPVSVVASLASIRVWPYCVTEYQMQGGYTYYAEPSEIDQISDAHLAARNVARDHVKSRLGSDALHGVKIYTNEYRVGEGDEVIECTLKGTRVRRFRDFEPLSPPQPTVRLT